MWVFTSKRFPGSAGLAPRVDFCIGAVKIAEIMMRKDRGGPWQFALLPANGEPEWYPTFKAALHRLHELLNSPPPEGFDTGTN